MDKKKLQHELDRAKIRMMMNPELTFFISIVLSLKFYWDSACGTAWVDGYKMGFNPSWWASLTEDERVGVMAHEAMHVALDHIGRGLGYDQAVWGEAIEHPINLHLKRRGIKLPVPHVADPRFENMSADQIYHILMKERTPGGGGWNDVRAPEGKDPKIVQQHIETIIMRAATQAQMAGQGHNIPGAVQVYLKGLMAPKLPWQQLLRREVNGMTKHGHSWLRPNRRYYPEIYLPTRWSRGLKRATFYVDISGSVLDFQFNIFVSEIAGAMKMYNIKEVTIVQFDCEIKSVDVVHSITALRNIKFTGRGGTCVECILDHMTETKPELAIVITDGEFDWHRDTFSGRILWLINDNPEFEPLFGRAIHFTTHDNPS